MNKKILILLSLAILFSSVSCNNVDSSSSSSFESTSSLEVEESSTSSFESSNSSTSSSEFSSASSSSSTSSSSSSSSSSSFSSSSSASSSSSSTSSSSSSSTTISSSFSSSSSESSSITSSSESSSSSINSSSSSSSSESSSSSSSEEVVTLSEPVLTIDDETGVVTWLEVEGATHYNYIINDGEIQTITTTTVTLKDKENISVQASSDNACSEFSKAVTYYDTSDISVINPREVKVYFYDSDVESITTYTGQTISRPNTPSKLNHEFDDWYKDPFYKEKFDFSTPITGKTVIYAKWNLNDLIKDTYFWAKVSPKISSSIISSTTNSTDWKFVPLKVNTAQTEFKEFYCTVTVTGATSDDPAYFIFMDGFDDGLGRTYWKNLDGMDFKIKSDGTYNLYFSTEHEYSQGVNGLAYQITNTGVSYLHRQQQLEVINTPVVEVDSVNNVAKWAKDDNAVGYEIIINNEDSIIVTENEVELSKGEHISVRTIYQNDYKSNWSIPKANINYVSVDMVDKYVYVYFAESGESSYRVEKGSTVERITLDNVNNRTFEGWYLEPGCKNKVTFPYTVTENVTFYPKWNYSTEYYQLVNASGSLVGKFVLNEDNYDFYEFELKEKVLEATTYYVKSLDGKTTYQEFSIGKKGTYSIYFSEDKVWTDSGTPRNVYIRHDKLDIYFTNALNWGGTIYAYYWNNASGDKKADWPGVEMEYIYTNSHGQNVYKCQIDLVQYDRVIFSNNSSQTVDINISGVSNNQAYYTTDTKDGSGKYTCGTWTYSA